MHGGGGGDLHEDEVAFVVMLFMWIDALNSKKIIILWFAHCIIFVWVNKMNLVKVILLCLWLCPILSIWSRILRSVTLIWTRSIHFFVCVFCFVLTVIWWRNCISRDIKYYTLSIFDIRHDVTRGRLRISGELPLNGRVV